MTYSTYEESRFSGEPVNLYLFRYGDQASEIYAYCDGDDPVVFQGVTYVPIPIDRTKLSSSGSLDKSNVTVTTPQNTELAQLYLIYPPSSVTTLVMRQGHLGDPDDQFQVVWSGRVIGCARRGSKAEFTCEPVSTGLRRNGLRRRYQYGCPHVLYGPECKASKAAATSQVTVVSISGARVTLPIGWTTRPDKYVGGLFEWTNDIGGREIRTILKAENGGATLLLGGTTRGLSVGDTVDVILGCNHKAGIAAQPDGDCGPLHNNILNFGGMPYIPLKNPISYGVNQYYGG